jgi:hypothetical protein
MSMPAEKVEIGLIASPAGALRFTLDDSLKGVLDNTEYPLGGGSVFVDVTDRVRRFGISRGRSGLFSSFPAGQVNVEFNNHDRAFDPLFGSSPFAGDIVPRREIRVTSGTTVIYTGWIDDWNYSYTPDGDSVAEAIGYDAISILSGQTLTGGTPTSQLTGARVEAVLNDVNWSSTLRSIDVGQALLSAAPIEADTNAMAYLQQVASSEPGFVFVAKNGNLTFLDRSQSPSTGSYVTFGGTGVPFQNLDVLYGSDNLYNQVIASRVGGGTATATDLDSVTDYGLRSLSQTDLLLNSDTDLAELALVLTQRYSLPEYRFNSLEVGLHKLGSSQQNEVLGMEIGSIARVIFTPNGIGDAIDRYVQVISINHSVNPESHYVEFGFQSVDAAYLVLDDPEFGKLDTYSLSW